MRWSGLCLGLLDVMVKGARFYPDDDDGMEEPFDEVVGRTKRRLIDRQIWACVVGRKKGRETGEDEWERGDSKNVQKK